MSQITFEDYLEDIKEIIGECDESKEDIDFQKNTYPWNHQKQLSLADAG